MKLCSIVIPYSGYESNHIHIFISYFKHIHTGYKFNKYIVLQFGPVKIKVPNKLLQIG